MVWPLGQSQPSSKGLSHKVHVRQDTGKDPFRNIHVHEDTEGVNICTD